VGGGGGRDAPTGVDTGIGTARGLAKGSHGEKANDERSWGGEKGTEGE